MLFQHWQALVGTCEVLPIAAFALGWLGLKPVWLNQFDLILCVYTQVGNDDYTCLNYLVINVTQANWSRFLHSCWSRYNATEVRDIIGHPWHLRMGVSRVSVLGRDVWCRGLPLLRSFHRKKKKSSCLKTDTTAPTLATAETALQVYSGHSRRSFPSKSVTSLSRMFVPRSEIARQDY